MYYAHRYTDQTAYEIIHYFNGGSRILQPDQHDYLAWVAAGNKPTVEADGRFLSVVEGKLVVDPIKDATLFIENATPSDRRFLSIINNSVVVDPNKNTILAAEAAARVEAEIKANLREIDLRSIRSIREYLVLKEDASMYLKSYEDAAILERVKLAK